VRLTPSNELGNADWPRVRSEWRHAAALALTTVALVGCGGGDDGTATHPSATETQAASAPDNSTPGGHDERIADQAQLTLDDFPTGWQENDSDDESVESPCEAVKKSKDSAAARGFSPDFSKGENTEAVSYAYIYAAEPEASEVFDALASDDTRDCLGQAVADELAKRVEDRAATGSDVEVGDASTSRVSIDPLGDDREALRVQVPFSSEGIDVDLYIDAAYIRVGRGIALLTTSDVFSPFDDELRADLMSKLVRRLSTGLEE
jgi:hypothetical protein